MRTERPATILNVAEAAGVSKTTASDALRGSGRVSAETRESVRLVAERLGYVPNGAARHLRRAGTGAIGLYVPEVLTRSTYHMAFVFGVVEQAGENDLDVTVITARHARAHPPRVDGLILGDPLTGDPLTRRLMNADIPTVTCERFSGGGTADGVVWSDHAATMGELLDHLRAAGSVRPALLVAGDESDWAAGLHRGYRGWCRANGIEPRSRTVPFDAPDATVRTAGHALLDMRPDALICGPAGSVAQLMPVIEEAGRRVGDDLLLAACVDNPELNLASPPVTAIDLCPRKAGAACARLLIDLLTGAADPGTERIHPVRLIPRASTTAPEVG